MSPLELKMVIRTLKEEVEVPISLLCRRFEVSRSTLYRETKRDDRDLIDLIKEISFERPSWGYRRIHAEMRRRGIVINHKKCYRLYCNLNLKRTCKFKKKNNRERAPFFQTEALYPGHVWAGDFMHERLVSGRYLRIFNVIDVYSRRAFEPLVEFSMSGDVVASHFERLIMSYGVPRVFRRDDGVEFRSKAFQKVLKRWRIRDEVIPAGQPFQNGFIESFNGTMREELLEREEFESIREAREKILKWVKEYNTLRPHSGIGYRTPMEAWEKYYETVEK